MKSANGMKSAAMWLGIACWGVLLANGAPAQEFRRLSVAEYRDRMAGGWIGQMVGVGWGAPTEFKFNGEIIPEDKVPVWKPSMVNQFRQDDIYVEMTFLRTMELYGLDCSIRQAGIDFANSGYPLWHANRAGRDNLRNGIAPPDSGHPKFNTHADDIDYQIEADFSGLIAPGMPNVVIELGEKFGRLMNYGDGVYGGQFVGGMYAEAFFEDDPQKIVEAGLACIPAESQYAECIRDTLRWWKANPGDWQKTWQSIEDKYQKNPAYRKFSCSKPGDTFNIDAKINGAYIVMGLLYGGRELEDTIVMSMRCGQDSDCNPSNSGGVLCTTVGQSKMDARFVSELNPENVFSHTAYNFPALVQVCEKLARQAVVKYGGRIEKTAEGDVFVILVEKPKPGKLEQCWEPGPAAESVFTDEEQAKIEALSAAKQQQADLQKVAPGWTMSNCGPDMDPGLRAEYQGHENVFMTHPLNKEVGCTLSREIEVPAQGKTFVQALVASDKRGDFQLIAKVAGKPVLEQTVTPKTAWAAVEIDLTPFAGKSVKVELVNQPNGWSWEAAYWAKVTVSTD
ncbi:MAG: ADP-ribosylglycohydrolase family protein [Planctomycetaceae bacterium]|nr:ADP-ribosylglycohydrolase family protein [Planctomycetaceae bacterium]